MTNINTLKITLSPLKADNRGQPCTVTFEGKTIIAKSHAPSHRCKSVGWLIIDRT
jgi:hypothetical protein